MASGLILDVCSLALDVFSSSQRGDKRAGILSIMEQGRLRRKEKDFE